MCVYRKIRSKTILFIILGCFPISNAFAQISCGGTPGVTCEGDVSTWTHSAGTDLTVGKIDYGKLVADGATIDTVAVWVSWYPNVVGHLEVKGGTNWTNDNNLSAGFEGIGTVDISGYGTVFTNNHSDVEGACPCPTQVGGGEGAEGTLIVRDQAVLNVIDGAGYGSSGGGLNGELIVGHSGAGTLSVQLGGEVYVNSLTLARANDSGGLDGASGQVTIDGPGSILVSETLVGMAERAGTMATMNVSNGGYLNVKGDPDDPAGYAWQEATLIVGEQGLGFLNVTGGGRVEIDRGGVGSTSGLPNGMMVGGTLMPGPEPGIGEVLVDGVGSRIDISGGSARILVGGGDNGTGRLEIRNGGVVELANTAIPGDFTEVMLGDPYGIDTEASLLVDGTGSKLLAGDSVTCGRAGDATMRAKSGGEISASYIFVGANCVASGDGSYLGTMVVESGGTLEPGNSPGNMTVGNNVEVESGGVLRLEVNGLSAAQYDTLSAGADIIFNPGSVVEIIVDTNTVSLAQLSTLELVDATSITGTTEVVAIDTQGKELQRASIDDIEASGGITAPFSDSATMDDLCPCDGPANAGTAWKNHGKYVSCVAHAVGDLVRLGELDPSETGGIVSAAAQSSCGK